MTKLKKIIFYPTIVSACLFAAAPFLVQCEGVETESEKASVNLQSDMEAAIAADQTPGALLLISRPDEADEVLTVGYANKADQTPIVDGQPFRIASMSKTFLAVTLLRLVEVGALKLDAKARDYLPASVSASRIANLDKVTVRQLLQMRSGIPNYTVLSRYLERIDSPNVKWTAELCASFVYDMPANFAAGRSYEYSNTNYILLQLIVENVTGASLASQIRKYVLEPLGLKASYTEAFEPAAAAFPTHGYSVEDGEVYDVTAVNDGFGLGDGGMISTAQDIRTFVDALLAKKTLLSADSLAAMLSFEDDYGLGIYPNEFAERSCVGHSGSASGFSGEYCYFADEQAIVVVLSNNAGGEAAAAILESAASSL